MDQSNVELNSEETEKVLKLLEYLEDLDDEKYFQMRVFSRLGDLI